LPFDRLKVLVSFVVNAFPRIERIRLPFVKELAMKIPPSLTAFALVLATGSAPISAESAAKPKSLNELPSSPSAIA